MRAKVRANKNGIFSDAVFYGVEVYYSISANNYSYRVYAILFFQGSTFARLAFNFRQFFQSIRRTAAL